MNIFVLDLNPKQAARFHVDAHVSKMCLEYAQLLCTAAHQFGVGPLVDYRPTHTKHPCALWLYEDPRHVEWLARLVQALGDEFVYRFGHPHQSVRVALNAVDQIRKARTDWMYEQGNLSLARHVRPEHFALAMPEECKLDDPVKSYRLYYNAHKGHLAKWTRRRRPLWWNIEETAEAGL